MGYFWKLTLFPLVPGSSSTPNTPHLIQTMKYARTIKFCQSNPPHQRKLKAGYTGRNPSPQRLTQTFGSHLPIIRFATHSLIFDFTETTCVHLHHLMTLADSSLLSLTLIECGNREVSNNWVNKVCQLPLRPAWIISLQQSQTRLWKAWIIWLW